MKRQLTPLQTAEEDVLRQINNWNEKKSKQIDSLVNSHAKAQMEELNEKSDQVAREIENTITNINQGKDELKEISDNYELKEKEIELQSNTKQQQYEVVCHSYDESNCKHQKDLVILNEQLKDLDNYVEKCKTNIQAIRTQLENAKKSYNSAKEAELISNKLQNTKIKESIELSTDKSICKDFDVYEIELPNIVCLPLQQNSIANTQLYKQENEITLNPNSIKLSSNIPDTMGSAVSPRTRCSSTRRSRKVSISNNAAAKVQDKVDNKENITNKYQKYLVTQKDAKSRSKSRHKVDHSGASSKSFSISKEEVNAWKNRRHCPSSNSQSKGSFDNCSSSLLVPDISQSNTMSLFGKQSKEIEKVVEQLVKGYDFYKKFAVKFSTKLPTFDPLKAKLCPPSNCGYGLKHFSVSSDHRSILISGDISIPLQSIRSLTIPAETKEMILKQKEGTKFKECIYYPFSMELERKAKLDLIATKYKELSTWIKGIEVLSKRKLTTLI